jgi:thiamine biosynthesis lipoprotein
MNSDLRLTVRLAAETPVERAAAATVLDACATWLAQIERTCSRFLADSELCALNASAGVPFVASPELFAVVRLVCEYAARTDGLFDPTILPALRAAGYTRTFDEIGHGETRWNAEDAEDAERFQDTGTIRARTARIQLDEATRTITLAPGVALDLGGIAKGWAADELARRFLASFPGYLIDLGGDLRVHGGPRDGEPWIVGIADPRVNAGMTLAEQGATYVAGLALTDGGIATSGDARRWWLRDGTRQHHLIDPRTGRPAMRADTNPDSRVLTCTALAPTAAEADVLAKVAFLLGYPDGLRMLSRGILRAGVCVFASGRVEASPNLEEYLYAHRAPVATAG